MKFVNIFNNSSFNIKGKCYISDNYKKILNFKDINYFAISELNNHILYKNIYLNFSKISNYFTAYGHQHEILSNCIIKSLDNTLNHTQPLLICPLIDILSLNNALVPIFYLESIIHNIERCFITINALKHITNLLLCNIKADYTISFDNNYYNSAYNEIYEGYLTQLFKKLLFKAMMPQNNINDYSEIYNILWIISNKAPFWISGLKNDEWILDVINLFDLYKHELTFMDDECEEIIEIRKILDELNVAHQKITSHHCYIPINIQKTHLVIHYPKKSDVYYNKNEFVPRYKLYLSILKMIGWNVVSISPIDWNKVKKDGNNHIKKYIKKILINYYKNFIIK